MGNGAFWFRSSALMQIFAHEDSTGISEFPLGAARWSVWVIIYVNATQTSPPDPFQTSNSNLVLISKKDDTDMMMIWYTCALDCVGSAQQKMTFDLIPVTVRNSPHFSFLYRNLQRGVQHFVSPIFSIRQYTGCKLFKTEGIVILIIGDRSSIVDYTVPI